MIQTRAPASEPPPPCVPPSSAEERVARESAPQHADDSLLALPVGERHEVVLLLLLDRAVRQVAPVGGEHAAAGHGGLDGGVEQRAHGVRPSAIARNPSSDGLLGGAGASGVEPAASRCRATRAPRTAPGTRAAIARARLVAARVTTTPAFRRDRFRGRRERTRRGARGFHERVVRRLLAAPSGSASSTPIASSSSQNGTSAAPAGAAAAYVSAAPVARRTAAMACFHSFFCSSVEVRPGADDEEIRARGLGHDRLVHDEAPVRVEPLAPGGLAGHGDLAGRRAVRPRGAPARPPRSFPRRGRRRSRGGGPRRSPRARPGARRGSRGTPGRASARPAAARSSRTRPPRGGPSASRERCETKASSSASGRRVRHAPQKRLGGARGARAASRADARRPRATREVCGPSVSSGWPRALSDGRLALETRPGVEPGRDGADVENRRKRFVRGEHVRRSRDRPLRRG